MNDKNRLLPSQIERHKHSSSEDALDTNWRALLSPAVNGLKQNIEHYLQRSTYTNQQWRIMDDIATLSFNEKKIIVTMWRCSVGNT